MLFAISFGVPYVRCWQCILQCFDQVLVAVAVVLLLLLLLPYIGLFGSR